MAQPQVSESPVTSTHQSDYSLAQENWARYQYGKDRGHITYMERAQKNDGMYMGGGRQWSDEDKAILYEQGRPFYEFNEVLPSVNSALGYQIQNRMDIAYSPRGEAGDLHTATILSKVVMQICAQCQFRWHETQVYADGLIEQRGYFDLRMNFDNNMKGEVELRTLDPRDVIPDPDSKSYDPDDWADVTITRWWTLDEIEGHYGKAARDRAAASNDVSGDFGEEDDEVERNKFGTANTRTTYDAYGLGADLERYRIIDRQKFVYQMTDCLVFPDTGDIKTADSLTEEQVADMLAAGAVKAKRMRKRIKWMVTTFSAVLHNSYSPYEHFTPIPYFAYFRRGVTGGLVDNAIGPQEALNKAVSQFVHIINTSANSGWTVEENSLTNMDSRELEEVGAKTGLVLEFKKGATPPKKIEANAVPSGVDRLIDRATQALKDVTVPDSMRGLQGNAVSGVAKQADQFASQQQLAVPMDNLGYTRRLFGLRVLKLIQRYYDSYRIIRITETDPMTGRRVEKNLEINKFDPATNSYVNDVTVGTYDLAVTEQPMQVTFQNGQFEQALSMRKEGIAIPDATVVRYSNLADKEDILSNMQQVQPDPLADAKAALLAAQTDKAVADTTAKNVEAQFSAIQTAQVIATTPATSSLADTLLKSAGYVDKDGGTIVPEAPGGMPVDPSLAQPVENTHPTFPANPGNPAAGMNTGIDTPADDSSPLP
jgi:hypothetical protein